MVDAIITDAYKQPPLLPHAPAIAPTQLALLGTGNGMP
jgi:hypothetical protein